MLRNSYRVECRRFSRSLLVSTPSLFALSVENPALAGEHTLLKHANNAAEALYCVVSSPCGEATVSKELQLSTVGSDTTLVFYSEHTLAAGNTLQ